MLIRLDKYLADMGLGTRSQVKADIKKGKININGVVVKDPNLKIDSERDKVLFEGNPIVYEEFEYYMLNKPAGIISATTDNKEKTVVDLIDCKRKNDLFPVGRLDRDTEGLLLICNDGDLSHKLLSPKKHVDKTYYVCLDKPIDDEGIRQVCDGVYIEKDVKSLPAKLEKVSDSQVFHAVGCEVTYLKRISMGSLRLDESLKPGEYRPLTEEEIKNLKETSV